MKITRRFEFDAGHRVKGHAGKCRHPHGHRYVLELHLVASGLNELGMVVDFGDIKAIVGEWIDRVADHGFIVWDQDTALLGALDNLADSKLWIVPCNPTAENLAALFKLKFEELFLDAFDHVTISGVTLHETPNCRAEV
tara:strand:+ start:11935 stop:12351 length:417 start_codon:yes stop_codon:yes gene_type:complete